jgi:hypothetical protein
MIYLITFITLSISLYFGIKKYIEFDKRNKSIKRKKDSLNTLNDFLDLIDENIIKQLRDSLKITNESDYIQQIEKLRQSSNLKRKYGNELAQNLEEEKWAIGMTKEQLIDAKGEPTKTENDVVRKIVKSKFGAFAQNKEKTTLYYGDAKFVFIDGKLENYG